MQYLKLQHIAIDREVMELVSTDALWPSGMLETLIRTPQAIPKG
jgi:hypothetical protein